MQIDLQKIIQRGGIDIKVLARELFPGRIYAVTALQRILSGKGKLDSEQVSRLAALLSVPIEQLYSSGWRVQSENGVHTFTNLDYVAIVDLNKMTTKLLHKDSLFHEEVLHSQTITLTELIRGLDKIIQNHCPKY